MCWCSAHDAIILCVVSELGAFLARLQVALQGTLPGEVAHARMRPPGRLSAPSADLPPARQAGVLLLLYPRAGALHFVLTQRAPALAHHRGQIALPGGQREAHDRDIVHTALREASEELGIAPEQVCVLGTLSSVYVQPSHFWMTPVVAYAPTRLSFRPAPSEVEAVIEVSLDALLDPRNRCFVQRVLSDGRTSTVPAFCFSGCEVWGATAMVLNEFAAVVEQASSG